jgi:hypothetical protein
VPSPVKEKTWVYVQNVQYGTTGTVADNREVAFNLKETFKANGWTILRTATQNAVFESDVWNTPDDVYNHRWFIAKNSLISSTAEFFFSFDTTFSQYGASGYGRVAVASSGFFPGTSSGFLENGPPAIDETTRLPGPGLFKTFEYGRNIYGIDSVPAASIAFRYHYWFSDIGFSIVYCAGGVVRHVLLFQNAREPVGTDTGYWVDPQFILFGTSPSYTNLMSPANGTALVNSHALKVSYGFEGVYGQPLGRRTSGFPDGDLSYPMTEPVLVSINTGFYSLLGKFWDQYGGFEILPSGTIYPAPSEGAAAWAQFGDLILPWEGSPPLIT